MTNLNPRIQRDEFRAFVGKKVMIGTMSYHYVSGRVEELDQPGNLLKVRVGGQLVLVPLDQVATIQEAPESQAEYVK
ncbi:MAG TPA: hypothetical protein VKN99_05310 [Polyangia bacterium]|nr:hypothetical protein [Polyangia bacterium]